MTVLTIENFHVPACGPPPEIVREADCATRLAYWESSDGDQLVLEIDLESRTGRLRCGDCGWDRVHHIRNGMLQGEILLSRLDVTWLKLAWISATSQPLATPAIDKAMCVIDEHARRSRSHGDASTGANETEG